MHYKVNGRFVNEGVVIVSTISLTSTMLQIKI